MTHRPLRQAAYLAVPALVLGALVAAPAPAQAAVDPRPVTLGSGWLADQLVDGALEGQFGPDYGLSADAALALLDTATEPGAVTAIRDRLAADIDDYVTGEAFGDAGSLYAGAAAKAAVTARAAGGDPRAFGGRDLVADVASTVGTATGTAGRISDTSTYGDFANTIGQSYAARALDEAGSDLAGPATDYLLLQQCEAGFFRLDLGATTADACGPGAEASVDVTGLALLNLAGQRDDADVAAATQRALGWLESVQGADGSFGSDAQITDANTNSTGLAGWALGDYGRTASAAEAATWVRARQSDDPAACRTALTGAGAGLIAYDDAGLAAARADGVTTESRDQLQRATAQALPALADAPAAIGTPAVTSPDGFRRAGSRESIGGSGFAPGATVCLSGRGTSTLVAATPAGAARTTVTLPRRTGTARYQATTGGTVVGTGVYRVLAATTPRLTYKQRPKRGTNQRVVVAGLVPDESVAVRSAGRVVARGTVNDAGRYVARFKVGSKLGKKGLTVTGEFGNRRASQSFVVVKGR